MRIEFTEDLIRSLFQSYSLREEKRTHQEEEECIEMILQCDTAEVWGPAEKTHFCRVCELVSTPVNPTAYAKFLSTTCDFLYWYKAMNVFDKYFASLTNDAAADGDPLHVLRALKQLAGKSINTEYFGLTDTLMKVIDLYWRAEIKNWRVLGQIFAVLDEVQEALNEQKTTLRFIRNIDLALNLEMFQISQRLNALMTSILKGFSKCLQWVVLDQDDPARCDIEQSLQTEFKITEVTPNFIEFVFKAFMTLLRDRSYGFTFTVEQFYAEVPHATTIANLILLIKNEHNRFSLDFMMHGLQVLDGLSCVDLISEFQNVDDKKNPYFKEACKYFNFYASLLRSFASANQTQAANNEIAIESGDVEMTTKDYRSSQKFLFAYLLFLQDMVELKTREMQNQLFSQIVEPLVCIITIKPSHGLYHVDLVCQEAAQQVLKSITKRSHVSDDSNLLQRVIERLKVELKILREDLSGQPNRWVNKKPQNDLEFCALSLEYRQKLIKSLIGFLCYSIVRVDPASLGQAGNHVPNSRKIYDSKLFEEVLSDFVFNANIERVDASYEKVVEPIFADCVQLYTFIGNDLPQHLGDMITKGEIMTTILDSLSRRVPVTPNIFIVAIKFLKMLNLNAEGTQALLASKAIEQVFQIGLDSKSYRAVVTRSKSQAMFDYQQLVHQFAKENLQIAERVYKQCIANLRKLYIKSWELTQQYLDMEKRIADSGPMTEDQKALIKNEYLKDQIKFSHCMEASCALVFYFCMEEVEYLEDIDGNPNNQSFVAQVIREQSETDLFFRLLHQPTICSLADGFMFNFLEAVSLIMLLQGGSKGINEYWQKLLEFTKTDFTNLREILGTDDLNSLHRLEAKNFVNLCEKEATREQRESLKQLKLSAILYLSIAKIHILVEILNIIQVFIRNYDKVGLFPIYKQFTTNLQTQKIGGLKDFYQFHALLSRHYASEINNQVVADESKAHQLITKHRESLEKYVWQSFTECYIPLNEHEEARNLYYRYTIRVVDSLSDKKAEDLVRQHFDFVLPETECVIHSIKCHKKIKTFMNQLSGICNKRRNQIDYDEYQTQHNVLCAQLFAEQVKIIADRCHSKQGFDKETVISTAICIELLTEVSRPLATKDRRKIFGVFLLNLLNQNDIVKTVGHILEWAITQYEIYEAMPGPKELFYARNIQQIINDCVQFLHSLLKVSYLFCGDSQSYLSGKQINQSYLCYFMKNHQFALGNNYPEAISRLQNLLYIKALLPISEILFSPKRICFASWHRFKGSINEQVVKIYAIVCSGSFEPQDLFKNQLRSGFELLGTEPGVVRRSQSLVRASHELVQQLTEMGFRENVVRAALRHYANNLELALEGLLRNEFNDAPESEEASHQSNHQEILAMIDTKLRQNMNQNTSPGNLMYSDEFGKGKDALIMESLVRVIRETFVPCLTRCFQSVPVHLQRLLIVKLFSFFKENLASPNRELYHLISDIFAELSNQSDVPEWFLTNFFMQILHYAKMDFEKYNYTELFLAILTKLRAKVADMTALLQTTQVSSQKPLPQAEEHAIDRVNMCLYNIHCQLSLLYYLITDFTAQQELEQLRKLTQTDEQGERSAFEEQVTFQDIDEIKKDSLFWPPDLETTRPVSLIAAVEDRQAIVKELYSCTIEIMRSFTNIPGALYNYIEDSAISLLCPVFKTLKQISWLQLPDFEFRQAFMKDNGLRLIFEMHVLDKEWQVQWMKIDQKESIQNDMIEILENVSNTARDLQNQYENVIQRQMFFQFKANFKRKSEDGSIQRDPNDYIIAGVDPEDLQDPLEPLVPGTLTKLKKSAPLTPNPAKRSKSLIKRQEAPETCELPSVKDVKRLIKKYEDLNEQNFTDFVRYYNSSDFSHVIVNFSVFLQACAKVCVIKKVPKKVSNETEESKDQQFDIKIMLKKQILKDLLTDPNFNYALPAKAPARYSQKLETPRCMQDILNQLLEMVIYQHKGYRMELLRQLRDPTLSNDENSLVEVTNGHLCIRKDKEVDRRLYFFDHLVILKLITFMIAKSKICTGLQHVLLRHNDSKTIKFIFRNIYFMLSLNLGEKQRELCINPQPNRAHIVVFFLSSILLDSPGRSVQAKQSVYQELTSMFNRQICKGLQHSAPHNNDDPWATTVTLLQKYQSIWLMQHFLTMRTVESLSAIRQKKIKFQRLQRTHMMKQIIVMFQQQANPVFSEQASFALLESIQSATNMLRIKDVYMLQDMRNKYLTSCVIVITKILRLFENSQSLGKFFAELGSRGALMQDPSNESIPSASLASVDDQSRDYFSEDDDLPSQQIDGAGSDNSDSDFPSDDNAAGMGIRFRAADNYNDNYCEFRDEEAEDEMSEGSWNFSEEAEEELMEDIIEEAASQQQINTATKPGPPPPDSEPSNNSGYSFGGPDDDASDDQSDEGSWDEDQGADLQQDQISYVHSQREESSFDQLGEEYDEMSESDSYDENNQLSYNAEEDQSQLEYDAYQEIQQQQRGERGSAFILRQSAQNNLLRSNSQYSPAAADMPQQIITQSDHFNLDLNTVNGQRSILPGLTFRSLIDQSMMQEQNIFQLLQQGRADSNQTSGFVSAIMERKEKIRQLREKMKQSEGCYLNQITTFVSGNNNTAAAAETSLPKTNTSRTAESSDTVFKHNPDENKAHMLTKPQEPLQQPQQRGQQQKNPLEIEGMDPLFMESLSPIGLQNIADAHRMQAQVSQQSNQFAAGFSVLFQDFRQFIRGQSHQRRQDILRQVQSGQCRDIPSDLYREAREFLRMNRDELLRLFGNNQNALVNQQQIQPPVQHYFQGLRNQQPERQEIEIDVQRDRLVSQDSVTISLDIRGPGDSQIVALPANTAEKDARRTVEHIRGDLFIQNFFIILQDINACYERDPYVSQIDKSAEQILSMSLIPLQHESPATQYGKIKSMIETAVTTFMNLDVKTDSFLISSIKILHRIPNMRVCLMFYMLRMCQGEIENVQRHYSEGKKCLPYQSKVFYPDTDELNALSFLNTINSTLECSLKLLSTVEGDSATEAVQLKFLEVIRPIQKDSLLHNFAQLIGLKSFEDKSIMEGLLELCLDFRKVCQEYPQALPHYDIVDLPQQFQESVIKNLDGIVGSIFLNLSTIINDVQLPVRLLCQVFFDTQHPIPIKSLDRVSTTLNSVCSSKEGLEVAVQWLESKMAQYMSQILDTLACPRQTDQLKVLVQRVAELCKIVTGIQKLKNVNICTDKLLTCLFQACGHIVGEEQSRIESESDTDVRHSLFVFRDEVRELLLLLITLGEYNLRRFFANKSEAQRVSSSQQTRVQTFDRQSFKSVAKDQNELSIPNLLQQKNIAESDPEHQRLRVVLDFFVSNKKLINRFIQMNSSLINKQLIQVAMMIPQVLDFSTKRVVWRMELKRLQQKYKNERFSFSVQRETTFQDSYLVLANISQKDWRGSMTVEFKGEDGIDEGGLFKEWLSNMSKEIFNEDMALFVKSHSGGTYYPNPKSTVQPNYIEMFTFVGKVFGKSLWDFHLVDCYFVKAFYKILLGMPLSYHDLEDYDEELYKSLNWMIENEGADALCRDFVETVEYFGEQKEIELCEGGKDISVTDENKFDYVQRVANFRLSTAIQSQIDAFIKGFYSVVPKELLKIFDNKELELLISGLQVIDVDDLRENTVYQGYTAQSKPVIYFFESLREFDNQERAEFIKFVTGSSKVPVEGFKGLRGQNGVQKFTIYRIPSTTQTRLPQSHTCHNQLDLPEYKDKETTKKMLLMAIKEGKTFGLA